MTIEPSPDARSAIPFDDAFHKAIVDNLAVGVYYVDRARQIVYWNTRSGGSSATSTTIARWDASAVGRSERAISSTSTPGSVASRWNAQGARLCEGERAQVPDQTGEEAGLLSAAARCSRAAAWIPSSIASGSPCTTASGARS